MNYVYKASTLSKNILKNSPEKCKKSGCSLCKSENPLCKKIPSEKNLLLIDSVTFCDCLTFGRQT